MGNVIKEALGLPERPLYGIPFGDWIGAAIIVAAVWGGLWVLRSLLVSRYQRFPTDKQSVAVRLVADLLGHTRQFLFLAVAIDAAEESLALPPRLQHVLRQFALLLVLLQAGVWARRALRFYLQLKERERGADRSFAGSLDIINFIATLLIWSLLILVALDNLGVNITALLAGLGVGGVAVALALQNVLGDLFASLSIALDKPFVVGDTLTIDTFTGVVERIGIKTTRLRSDAGEQIILSNADVLKSRVRNFGRAPELRALATVRVAYGTPAQTLREIPALLEKIVAEQPHARFERCHLKTLGEWALLYELTYFRQNPDAYPLLDLQHEVNCRIIDEFQSRGIELALPASRVFTAA